MNIKPKNSDNIQYEKACHNFSYWCNLDSFIGIFDHYWSYRMSLTMKKTNRDTVRRLLIQLFHTDITIKAINKVDRLLHNLYGLLIHLLGQPEYILYIIELRNNWKRFLIFLIFAFTWIWNQCTLYISFFRKV